MTIIALLIAFVGFVLLVVVTYLVAWVFGTVLGWLILPLETSARRFIAERRAAK